MEENNNLNETPEVENTPVGEPNVVVETTKPEPTNNDKKKKLIIIGIVVVVILIIACILVLLLKGNGGDTNNSENNTNTSSSSYEGDYGIAVRDLDVIKLYNSLIENRYGTVKTSGTTTTVTVTPEDEEPMTKKFENLNIKESKLSCDCGNDCVLYYLNDKDELHEIKGLFADDEDSGDNIIKKDVKSIDLKNLNTDFDSCGSPTLVITNNDGTVNTYHWYELSNYYDNNREFLTMGLVGGETSEDVCLYAVNPSAKIDYFLKDEKGNTLYAKTIVELNNFKEVYVIGENNKVYYFENFANKENGKVYKNKTVQSYVEEVDKLTITYADGSEETIAGNVFKRK